MSDTVSCGRCGETRAAIDGRIPFRSPLREQVLAEFCAECWKEWREMQIKVINEFALNLGDPRSHDIIESHAREFFGMEAGDGPAADLTKIPDPADGGADRS